MRNIQLTITVAGLTWLFSKPEVQDYLDTWSKKPWAFDKEAITDLGHTWADFLGLNKQGVDDCKQSWIDLGIQLGFTKDGFDEWKESWITFFGVSKDDIEDWKKSWQQFGIDLGFSKQGVEDWKKSWEPVTNMFKNIVSAAKTAWDNLGNGLESAWNHIKSTFKNGVNDIIRLINNGPIELINKLISAANNLPGNPFTIQKIQTISYLAQGGMPTLGSMFVAGEAGPELIGSYGGNPNTVMPLAESGFVEAMAAATFSAVSQAMKNAGGAGGSGDVYLDGVKVGEITQRSMMRAGKTGSLVSVRS